MHLIRSSSAMYSVCYIIYNLGGYVACINMTRREGGEGGGAVHATMLHGVRSGKVNSTSVKNQLTLFLLF